MTRKLDQTVACLRLYGYIRWKNRRLKRAFAHRRISTTQVAIKWRWHRYQAVA